jgi:hypothetical protein
MLIWVLSAAVGVVGAGCGGAETGNGQTQTATPSLAATHSTGSPGSSPSAGRTKRLDSSTSETPSSAPKQEDRMKIRIAIDEQRFQATLSDSAAARDLIAQLPVTIDMVDHGAVEKTGPLPSPLSLDGQPEGADPDVGDVGYYAPSSDLVLYYGDQSYYPGIVILGRLDADAAQRISALDGPITTTVEAHGD